MNGISNTSGSAVAKIDFLPVAAGTVSLLTPAVVEEFKQRLVVTIETTEQGNIEFSVSEPTDITKAWIQINPLNGLPIRNPKIWSPTQNAWVDVVDGSSPYEPPAKRRLSVLAVAGNSTVNQPFTSIQTIEYDVVMTPTLFVGGVWVPPPSPLPDKFGFMIGNKTADLLTLHFFGQPTGGLMWDVVLEAHV